MMLREPRKTLEALGGSVVMTWVHEEFYCADADDIGYCFERLHEAPQSEKSDPDEDVIINKTSLTCCIL